LWTVLIVLILCCAK